MTGWWCAPILAAIALWVMDGLRIGACLMFSGMGRISFQGSPKHDLGATRNGRPHMSQAQWREPGEGACPVHQPHQGIARGPGIDRGGIYKGEGNSLPRARAAELSSAIAEKGGGGHSQEGGGPAAKPIPVINAAFPAMPVMGLPRLKRPRPWPPRCSRSLCPMVRILCL
jgi:hypothetical protein